jgi:hypothetical protein
MPVINLAADVIPDEAPCNWPIITECCPDWDSLPSDVRVNATAWATEILWALTGRRFGTCQVTVRPCGSSCGHGGWFTWPVDGDGYSGGVGGILTPYNYGGTWFNCACPGACSCKARCEVVLADPVESIVSVVVDGITLDPSAYRVDNGSILVRTDGECWPRCQDLNLSNTTDVGTFFVTYNRGVPVPVGGQLAAGLLACDFAKSCTSGCKLPGNLSTLSRQGVEITMVDPTEALGQGLTGISSVDLWIRSVNPYQLASRPRVRSLDVNPYRVTTS